MTISSSLAAGVSGLNANAMRLATIADNIANASTYGYKRTEADFQSMVNGSGAGSFSAGGVRSATQRIIGERGPLVSTSNPTDLAVDGRGMLPVTTAVAADSGNGDLPLQLMTTGAFRPDEQGVLKSETGMVLLGWPADVDGTIPPYRRDTAAGLEPVRINLNQFAGNPTTRMTLGVNLPATATAAGADGAAQQLSVEYFDNMGTSQTLDITFTPAVPATGSSNAWTMTVRDSASAGAPVGEYALSFDDTRGSSGTLRSVTTLSGGPYDPASGTLDLTVAGGSIALDIGAPGGQDGLTQLSDRFAPVSISKNGSPVGNVTSVEVDEKGLVQAVYDAGFTRTIFQVPLVDVPNPDGLVALANQSYRVSPDSGPFYLWNAGEGPTGSVAGFSREESATDVAAELTQLIQTQRAYSSNAKVIQTVDEMLQETTNIKR